MNEEETAPPTTLIDLLNRLAEPPEPPPIAMTPQTAGWTVLALLILMLLAWLGFRFWKFWNAAAYRRAAMAELDAAGDDPTAIADILRRTALAAWPREKVANLTGVDWLAFLDATGGVEDFTKGAGSTLAEAPYHAEHSPVPGLGEIASRWVRKHRVEAAA